MPAILAATALAGLTGTPLRWRWAASEAAFNRLVATLPPHGAHQPVDVPAHLGPYSISLGDVYPDGYVFTDSDTANLTDCGSGFAYLPTGRAGFDLGSYEFVRLDGAWYQWRCYS
jgi:hypothetical protein